jgi:hypothetical protein
MKKISKLLLLLFVLLFAGINNAMAIQDCSSDEIYGLGGDFTKSTHVIMEYGGVENKYDVYSLHYENNKTLPAYCRQPSYVNGMLGSKTNYKCTRVVYDPTTPSSKDDNQKAFDAGVSYIAKGLYRNGSTEKAYLKTFGISNTNNDEDYTTTNLALRIYEMLWTEFNINGKNKSPEYNQHIYVANKWVEGDNTLKQLVKKATNKTWKKLDGGTTTNFKSSAVESAAKAKLKAALEYVGDYRTNGGASIIVPDNGLKTTEEIEDSQKNIIYKGKAFYNIEISQFVPDGAFIALGFECTNCKTAKRDVTVKIDVNDSKDVTLDPKTNLIELTKLGKNNRLSGNIKVTVNFEANAKKFDCGLIDYKLKIYYFEKNISGKVYEVYPEDLKAVTNVQGFWVAEEPNNQKTTITIDDTMSLCVPLASGQNCKPNVINAECSDPGYSTNFDILEGYEVDDECNQKSNVLGCVVNGQDAAGNPYVVMQNKYCTVSCKEDYNFTFPGNKGVVNGGYFTLSAKINGKKTCYTSRINTDLFLQNYCESAKETVAAYNEIQKINEYLKITKGSSEATKFGCKEIDVTDSETKETVDGSKCRNITQCSSQVTACENNCPIVPLGKRMSCMDECNNKTYTYVKERKTHIAVKCDKNITYKIATIAGDCKSGGESDASDPYYSDEGVWPAQLYTDGDKTKASERFQKAYGEKETTTIWQHGSGSQGKRMGSVAITQTHIAGDSSIAGLLGQINSCQAWNLTDYNFDPKMYYWYEFGSGQFKRNPEKIQTTKLKSKAYVCTGNVDNSYELCNDKKDGWIVADEDHDYFQSTTQTIFYCDSDGCGTHSYDVNNASYVKRSLSASADFTALTKNSQISPSGIIINDGKGELKEKLPVPLGLDLKPHNYVIYVTDLGEYRAGKLGRIWGNPRSVLSTTLRTKDKCQNSKDLTYDRTIETSYFDNGVYSCTYTTDDRPSCYSLSAQKDIDLTDCIASGKTRAQCEKEYDCVATCTHPKTGEEVPMEDCIKGKMSDKSSYDAAYNDCKKEKCCPNCPPVGICTTSGGKYYGIKGTEVTEEQYNDECFCEKKDGKSTELFSIRKCMKDENKTAEECKLECKSKTCPPPGCPPRLVCNGKLCFSVRPISPDNINPNDRSMGANWASDDKAETALELKAYVTTQEIVEDGEKIYDYDSAGNFAMEVTLDGKMINFIKEYNNKHDKGGYADNSLECYPYTVGGVTYKNVFCYSTFIDELLKPGLKNKIKIKPERPTSDKRKNYTPTENGYWTPWNFAKLDSKWTIETEQELAYYKKGYGKTINIGPSWK